MMFVRGSFAIENVENVRAFAKIWQIVFDSSVQTEGSS